MNDLVLVGREMVERAAICTISAKNDDIRVFGLQAGDKEHHGSRTALLVRRGDEPSRKGTSVVPDLWKGIDERKLSEYVCAGLPNEACARRKRPHWEAIQGNMAKDCLLLRMRPLGDQDEVGIVAQSDCPTYVRTRRGKT